jgi:hypothetical protein
MILHVTLYNIVLYILYMLYYYIVCYKSSFIYGLAAWDLAKGWNDDFGFSDEACLPSRCNNGRWANQTNHMIFGFV